MKGFILILSVISTISARRLPTRCLILFDESCATGDYKDVSSDEDHLNGDGTPGKRCAGLFTEGCDPGKDGYGDEKHFSSDDAPGKRCASPFSDNCSNGGIEGAADDEGYLTGGGSPGRRCAHLFDVDCTPEPLPDDEFPIFPPGGPGKRCAGLFGESCSNGGVADAVDDESWLISGGSTPGKRSLPQKWYASWGQHGIQTARRNTNKQKEEYIKYLENLLRSVLLNGNSY